MECERISEELNELFVSLENMGMDIKRKTNKMQIQAIMEILREQHEMVRDLLSALDLMHENAARYWFMWKQESDKLVGGRAFMEHMDYKQCMDDTLSPSIKADMKRAKEMIQ